MDPQVNTKDFYCNAPSCPQALLLTMPGALKKYHQCYLLTRKVLDLLAFSTDNLSLSSVLKSTFCYQDK